MAYEQADQFESSEQAYRQALAMNVRENNLPSQADTLRQLGNLYDRTGRMEDAATFYRQAVDIHARSGNVAQEGKSRGSLARTLLVLCRYDEARLELQRAIECLKPYGHAAEPWKTWATLENLERATGNADEARAARNRAIETYLAYRRAGGHSQSNLIELFTLIDQAIHQNTQHQVARQLSNLLEPDAPPWLTALIQQLQSILAGDRDPTLATDTRLDCMNAAELLLLLETFDQENPIRTQN
jgi:tetratricopeptide (TPR) repeat protein